MSVDASPCSKSGFLLVTLSIQNAITSWNNFGRWQGWFECRKGPTVCADRNPKMWLANGSTANLTFVYEPDFLNLGTGKGDYRMRFLGTTTAVNAALQQLQIRGSSLGSNILKIEVEDRPAAFAYDVRFDEFWNPKSLFRTEIGMSVEQAQLACKYVAAHTPPPCPHPRVTFCVSARASWRGAGAATASSSCPHKLTTRRWRRATRCRRWAAP